MLFNLHWNIRFIWTFQIDLLLSCGGNLHHQISITYHQQGLHDLKVGLIHYFSLDILNSFGSMYDFMLWRIWVLRFCHLKPFTILKCMIRKAIFRFLTWVKILLIWIRSLSLFIWQPRLGVSRPATKPPRLISRSEMLFLNRCSDSWYRNFRQKGISQ